MNTILIVSVFIIFSITEGCYAEMFKNVDTDGRVTYKNKPSPGYNKIAPPVEPLDIYVRVGNDGHKYYSGSPGPGYKLIIKGKKQDNNKIAKHKSKIKSEKNNQVQLESSLGDIDLSSLIKEGKSIISSKPEYFNNYRSIISSDAPFNDKLSKLKVVKTLQKYYIDKLDNINKEIIAAKNKK